MRIDDKISKILDIFSSENLGGFLVSDGKLIENPQDTTFAKQFTKDKTKFALVSGSSQSKSIKWIRFPEFYLTDYFYMSSHYWDAMAFIPKRNVTFFGFGLMANYNGKNMKVKFQWNINDQDS